MKKNSAIFVCGNVTFLTFFSPVSCEIFVCFVQCMPINDSHATYHISVKIVRQHILQCAQASLVEGVQKSKSTSVLIVN